MPLAFPVCRNAVSLFLAFIYLGAVVSAGCLSSNGHGYYLQGVHAVAEFPEGSNISAIQQAVVAQGFTVRETHPEGFRTAPKGNLTLVVERQAHGAAIQFVAQYSEMAKFAEHAQAIDASESLREGLEPLFLSLLASVEGRAGVVHSGEIRWIPVILAE